MKTTENSSNPSGSTSGSRAVIGVSFAETIRRETPAIQPLLQPKTGKVSPLAEGQVAGSAPCNNEYAGIIGGANRENAAGVVIFDQDVISPVTTDAYQDRAFFAAEG